MILKGPPSPITASMLYDLVGCPHRVTMDLFADPANRDPVNAFVQLLWDRGAAHEVDVIETLVPPPPLDLSKYSGEEKEARTREAMEAGVPLIYSGRITADNLIGEPDLLRKEGTGYIAGDIKSGAGEEGGDDGDDGKPKKHYAVQLALYTDILERLGRSAGRRAFIWDIDRNEVTYDLTGSLWDLYQGCLAKAQSIVSQRDTTLPASSGICKQCIWYHACLRDLERRNDLTLIPELGRTKRDALATRIATIRDLAAINPADFIVKKKTVFPGIGPEALEKLHARALLLTTGGRPYLRESVTLPTADTELFFDIEVDPMRDLCYLHGFVMRRGGRNDTERFVSFFAEDTTPAEEERAFAGAWRFMQESQPCAIYYYSKYERTIYRKLQEKYPEVCSADEIEELFSSARTVDLYYDVVRKATEWPTRDYSIKTLASYLGFGWRDAHPSGAASIEWFDRWVQTQDPADRQRILDYNEDDCRATRVLLDGIKGLTLR